MEFLRRGSSDNIRSSATVAFVVLSTCTPFRAGAGESGRDTAAGVRRTSFQYVSCRVFVR